MLHHTPDEISKRQALKINPAKTCQPIGAMYAALGIHGCLPHSHGSQGCCSYHRSHLTRHYKEPVMASTSSFTEGASVFGGAPNLRQSLKTIFQVYEPDIVAVHTTCLSETIGDDLPSIIKGAVEDKTVPEGKHVIYCNTPSYVGSHVTGYSNMAAGIVKCLCEKDETEAKRINVIPGFTDPSDMRKIKGMLKEMKADFIMFPDTSGVLDTPQTAEYKMYPDGGAKISDIMRAGGSSLSLCLGKWSSEAAGVELEKKCSVPFKVLDLPIGVLATDRFVEAVSQEMGLPVPKSIRDERGKLVDMLTDYQQYLYKKKVAIFGDPDTVIPMTEFLLSAGMMPKHIITGTPGKAFEKRIDSMMKEHGHDYEYNCSNSADLFYLHQLIKNEPVDLLIGNTYGKYIAAEENIPFVRFGFPILDRVGHSHFPKAGYMGGMHFISGVINTLLDKMDRDTPEDMTMELVA
jgi:nitrogenase molybdenum-iron protein beta chain